MPVIRQSNHMYRLAWQIRDVALDGRCRLLSFNRTYIIPSPYHSTKDCIEELLCVSSCLASGMAQSLYSCRMAGSRANLGGASGCLSP